MKIDKVITLANSKVRLRFLAMERSLRDTGSKVPLLVIPYDDDRFELPANAQWWEIPELASWLTQHKAHPTMRKYQCLLESNYQFVDSDVIFLEDPAKTLHSVNGFITSCGHWNNPGHTYTKQSLDFLKEKSTLWQKYVFNTGQFACDKPLYTLSELKAKVESKAFIDTCLTFPYHEQPGVNLLVNASGISITNLTLPPCNMESTWAGNYSENNFDRTWNEHKPYLIHWAGCEMNTGRPIDQLFLKYLTDEERKQWNVQVEKRQKDVSSLKSYIRRAKTKIKRMYHLVKE